MGGSNRKYQVFVSSTYLDLRKERQAAVEGILDAGHIPAGMELFAAGDKSQLEVIRRWIEESDVFMLILGARYGSVDEESGKSYIQLEYEYALSLDKPLYAVVMSPAYRSQHLKEHGETVLERDNVPKYTSFRDTIRKRMCKDFDDLKDIKLAIFQSLQMLIRDRQLIGWVRADEVASPAPLIEELRRLQKENQQLRSQVLGARASVFEDKRVAKPDASVPKDTDKRDMVPPVGPKGDIT